MAHIGIVGHGFVGKAVEFGFTNPSNKFTIADPRYGTDVATLLSAGRLDAIFICVPTPMGKNGEINSSIVENVVKELLEEAEVLPCPIIIKSTVMPNVLINMSRHMIRSEYIVYNPEFLRENTANEDFINPEHHVFGGERAMCKKVYNLYLEHSNCNPAPAHFMTLAEASFVKYGANCFLATKVLWFNQFYDIVTSSGSNYNTVMKALTADTRIGKSHTAVPGFDGKRGFGGACFPKDAAALVAEYPELSVLLEVIIANNRYRAGLEKDSRELEQNITYGELNGTKSI